MTKKHWVTVALTNDAVVAELLIRMKELSSLNSSRTPATSTSVLLPIRWGHQKSRSKPSPITTTNAAGGSGFRKEQQSGSPTTPLCWSGGGASTSDGYDESTRPSDLSSGGRSTKGGAFLANEGTTTSRKRKSFAELKEEENFLLKQRKHLNKELESMRIAMNKQIATSQNLKKFNIDLRQNLENEKTKMKATITVNHPLRSSYMVEPDTEAREKGFVLPDLNMTPNEQL